jgi:hypothetical protein
MSTFPINPTSVSFTHKKGNSLPSPKTITYTSLADYVSYDNLPTWLTISNITSTSLAIALNSNVESLAAGSHNASVEINDNYNGEPRVRWSDLLVNLTLQDTIDLEVSPTSLAFTFTVGGSNPAAKIVSVTSENSWTVSKNANWLSLSASSGSGTGSFNISITGAGLSPGTYNDTVTVDDGVDSIDIPVSLTVSNPDTGSDYLYAYPSTLKFGYSLTGIIPPPKSIDINASAAFTAAASQSWIDLSFTSGSSGTSSLVITMQNVSGLSAGTHIGYVDLTLGSIIKRITIELSVYAFVTEMLTPGQLYFSDDDNNIKVSSGRSDTHLNVNISSNYQSVLYTLDYNVPFFQGVATKRIGSESRKIIGDPALIGATSIYAVTPYQPVVLDLLINELDLYNDDVIQTVNLAGIKMIKGCDPGTDLLSNLPEVVYMTRSGLLIFSVKSQGNPIGNIVISGDASAMEAPSIPTADFYTVVVSMTSLSNLKAGDELVVTALSQSVTVVIQEPQLESSIAMYETQWGTFEAYEFTGEIIETVKTKQSKYVARKNHREQETRVLTSEKTKSYKVNTGYVMSEGMAAQLEHLIHSKNIWLNTGAGFVKVRSVTSSLNVRSTNSDNMSFSITFEEVLIT